ncbi:hypothetical protein Q7P37_010927 [Cladosporium fusiforme]
MHVSLPTVAVILAASSRTLATTLQARDGVTINYSDGPFCQGTSAVVADAWGVYMPGNVMGVETDANGLGGGLLDNLRGRCGVITGWNPKRDGAGTGLGATFSTSDFCTQFDITQAILAASGGTNVDCTFNGDAKVTIETIGQALEVIGQAVKEIAGDIGLLIEAAE